MALARNLALLFLLAVVWASSYTLIRVGVSTVPPLTLVAVRMLIAALLLWGCVFAFRVVIPRQRSLWRRFLIQSLLQNVLPFTLVTWGEQWVPAGLATILNSTTPIFALLATALITRHERVTPVQVFGVIFGLVGVCLVVGYGAINGSGGRLLAELAIVLASVFYAGASIHGQGFRDVPPLLTAAGAMSCGFLVLAPLSLAIDHPWAVVPSHASVMAILALAIFPTALAFIVYFQLMQALGSLATTSQSLLRVPIGVCLGVVFLGESLTTSAWLGLLSVVVSVIAITVPSSRAHSRAARSPS